jgi:hypothetical protein
LDARQKSENQHDLCRARLQPCHKGCRIRAALAAEMTQARFLTFLSFTRSRCEIPIFPQTVYASERDSSKPLGGSFRSADSRMAPQSRHSTYSASESLAINCVREWRQVAGSFTRRLLDNPDHSTGAGSTWSPPEQRYRSHWPLRKSPKRKPLGGLDLGYKECLSAPARQTEEIRTRRAPQLRRSF